MRSTPELGELLHDQLGPLALHQRERHADRRRRAGHLTTAPSGSTVPAAPSRTGRQRPATVADGEPVAGPEPQRPAQVVASSG